MNTTSVVISAIDAIVAIVVVATSYVIYQRSRHRATTPREGKGAKWVDFGGWDIRLWIEEQGSWVAELVDFPKGYVSAFGDTPEQAIAELREVWAALEDMEREDGYELPLPSSQLSSRSS